MSQILHHLIKASQAEALLKEYSSLVPGSGLALLRPDGALFAASSRQEGEAAAREAFAGGSYAVLPILAGGEVVAQIASRATAAALLPALQRTFSLLAQGNLEKREVARETLDRYREINLLYSTTETIGACLDPDEIPTLVLRESARVIPAGAGLVLLRSDQGEGALEQKAVYPLPEENPPGGPPDPRAAGFLHGEGPAAAAPTQAARLLQAGAELVDYVMQNGRPDIRSGGGASEGGASGDGAFAALLCAPLKARTRALGVVLLGRAAPPAHTGAPRRGEDQIQFTAGEEKLLMVLASQAGVAIEKAWMHHQELERQRMEQELAISRRIQRSLLPERLPHIPGWEFAAYYQAAREVGGDFYDFFEGGPTLGLFIADVTGKGVPAALMMAFSRAMLRSLLQADLHFVDKPAQVLQRLNSLLLKDNRTGMLLTALYGALEPRSGRVVLANAGHERPLWVRARTVECIELESNGALLGAFGSLSLEERQVFLEPGDQLVFYTDGVSEARNPQGELFGEERLKEALCACLSGSAEEGARAILEAVQSFAAGQPQSDDFTIIIIKRVGG